MKLYSYLLIFCFLLFGLIGCQDNPKIQTENDPQEETTEVQSFVQDLIDPFQESESGLWGFRNQRNR